MLSFQLIKNNLACEIKFIKSNLLICIYVCEFERECTYDILAVYIIVGLYYSHSLMAYTSHSYIRLKSFNYTETTFTYDK